MKDYQSLIGMDILSHKLLENHFTLYEGYVNNTNKIISETKKLVEAEKAAENPGFSELKRRLGWEWNGMRLHECFFENITKDPTERNQKSGLEKQLTKDFKSHIYWEEEFKAICSIRGIGWAGLYYDQIEKKLLNVWIGEHDAGHLSNCELILVIDLFEHAYMLDYGTKKPAYIDKILKHIYWPELERRFESVTMK